MYTYMYIQYVISFQNEMCDQFATHFNYYKDYGVL